MTLLIVVWGGVEENMDIKKITITPYTFTGVTWNSGTNLRLVVYGKLVQVFFDVKATVAATETIPYAERDPFSNMIANVPAGYRPEGSISVGDVMDNSGVRFYIYPNGDVKFRTSASYNAGSATNHNGSGSAFYIAAN